MMVAERPYVVEFNARFGDPEAQVLLVRLAEDLLPLLDGAARGELRGLRADFVPDAAVCVVMAAAGYPGPYAQGQLITGLQTVMGETNTWVFHAGTAMRNGHIVTSGGRVLGVTARAPAIALAVQQAYQAVGQIQWPGAYYRRDIGYRALGRTSM
jgi:phosphoribosylamine--glycine ligase